MDFAKNLLEKYGWKEGQGIGKNADGVSKPIKASLKFDNAGLGHDKAQEFTNRWWEQAYNNAANNLQINTKDNQVSMSLKNGESIEISEGGNKNTNQIKSNYVGSFVKSSFALNKEDSSDDEEIEIKSNENKLVIFPTTFTDEDLLKACGGRTAHKGARHGLKLSGKLSRIEAQERKLLEQFSNSTFNKETAQEGFRNWMEVSKKKKHKKKADVPLKLRTVPVPEVGNDHSPDVDELGNLINQSDYVIKYKSKKRKKKDKAIVAELAASLGNLKTDSTMSPPKIKEKLHCASYAIQKKCKKIEVKLKASKLNFDCKQADVQNSDETAPEATSSKRKRKSSIAFDSDHYSEESYTSEIEEINQQIKKICKKHVQKQKENREFEKIAKKIEKSMNIEEQNPIKKKKKKKKKSNKKRKE